MFVITEALISLSSYHFPSHDLWTDSRVRGHISSSALLLLGPPLRLGLQCMTIQHREKNCYKCKFTLLWPLCSIMGFLHHRFPTHSVQDTSLLSASRPIEGLFLLAEIPDVLRLESFWRERPTLVSWRNCGTNSVAAHTHSRHLSLEHVTCSWDDNTGRQTLKDISPRVPTYLPPFRNSFPLSCLPDFLPSILLTFFTYSSIRRIRLSGLPNQRLSVWCWFPSLACAQDYWGPSLLLLFQAWSKYAFALRWRWCRIGEHRTAVFHPLFARTYPTTSEVQMPNKLSSFDVWCCSQHHCWLEVFLSAANEAVAWSAFGEWNLSAHRWTWRNDGEPHQNCPEKQEENDHWRTQGRVGGTGRSCWKGRPRLCESRFARMLHELECHRIN